MSNGDIKIEKSIDSLKRAIKDAINRLPCEKNSEYGCCEDAGEFGDPCDVDKEAVFRILDRYLHE